MSKKEEGTSFLDMRDQDLPYPLHLRERGPRRELSSTPLVPILYDLPDITPEDAFRINLDPDYPL